MKNNSVFFRCVFLVSFLLFHVLQAHSVEQSSASVKADTQRLKVSISKISKSVKLKENQWTRLQNKIYSFDRKIEKLGRLHRDLIIQQADVQARLDGLKLEKTDLQANIDTSIKSMSELIRAFHLIETRSSVKSLINGDNITSRSRMKVYHDYLIKEYLAKYQQLNAQYEAFGSIKEKLSKRVSELELLTNRNKQQTEKLQKSYVQRDLALGKLTAQIKSAKVKLRLLKADRKRLGKLAQELARLESIKPSGMSFAKHKGGLLWPVEGRVTNKFGRTKAGSRLKWRGVLIETKAGASVTSVAVGRVVFSDWLSGYGFVVIIDHGKGYMSLYAHNQQLLVNVGDKVQKNHQVALAGSSGRNGKPALYFEIRRKGKPINPSKWIASRKSRK